MVKKKKEKKRMDGGGFYTSGHPCRVDDDVVHSLTALHGMHAFRQVKGNEEELYHSQSSGE